MTYRSSSATGIFLNMEHLYLQNIMWTWECYEHEQLDNMHMSVPEHSYQYDIAFVWVQLYHTNN